MRRPMPGHADSRRYWDAAAATVSFSHPLNLDWLGRHVAPEAAILDYGCGYGRSLNALFEQGYRNAQGVNISTAMIARGVELHSHLRLQAIDGPPLPFADGAFDAVLLFAVLTCIVGDEDQRALIAEFRRLLRPGGVLYLSDPPLQPDARNLARYDASIGEFGVYGAFRTAYGAVFRHHDPAWLAGLLSDFDGLESEEIDAKTFNGNPTRVRQLIARRR
jgi:SAM-dependent methyltransferase